MDDRKDDSDVMMSSISSSLFTFTSVVFCTRSWAGAKRSRNVVVGRDVNGARNILLRYLTLQNHSVYGVDCSVNIYPILLPTTAAATRNPNRPSDVELWLFLAAAITFRSV